MIPGGSPLILTFARTGTNVPPVYYRRLSLEGRAMADTDWHLDRLMDGLHEGVTRVRANFNRCMSDVNTGPSDPPPYQGVPGAGFIPLRTATGAPIWAGPPLGAELSRIKSAYYVPYHAAVAAQVARVRAKHRIAFVIDCQSMQADPDAHLPDLSLDTGFGLSCSPKLAAQVAALCQSAPEVRSILNRARHTGWTTRLHGRPKSNVHALQVTVAQSAYLGGDADTLLYDAEKAEALRALLRDMLGFIAGWRPD